MSTLYLRLESIIGGERVSSEQRVSEDLLQTYKLGAPALLGMIYNDLRDMTADHVAKNPAP